MPKTYTLQLDANEAASIRVMLKKAFQSETSFIEMAKKDLEIFPGAQSFIDYAEKERALYAKVYEALCMSDEDRSDRAALEGALWGWTNKEREAADAV